jgi:hypothetical protein
MGMAPSTPKQIVGVGSSPAGLCARLRKLDASERTYKTSPSALSIGGKLMRRSESNASGSILGLTRRNEGYIAENSRLVPGFL